MSSFLHLSDYTLSLYQCFLKRLVVVSTNGLVAYYTTDGRTKTGDASRSSDYRNHAAIGKFKFHTAVIEVIFAGNQLFHRVLPPKLYCLEVM